MLKNILFFLAFFRLSLTNNDCSEDTPWFCKSREISITFGHENIYRDSGIDYNEIVDTVENLEIPEYFDAREKWPDCRSLSAIPNQGICDVSFAFCITTALDDRLCISSDKHDQFEFSVQDFISCWPVIKVPRCTNKINIFEASSYLVTNGVVSEGCKHYDSTILNHLECDKKCDGVDKLNIYDKRTASSFVYGTLKKTDQNQSNLWIVQKEIMKHGPVCVPLYDLPDTFRTFTGQGVYKSDRSVEKNGTAIHFMKLIGWGKDGNGTLYWIAANSWNIYWGDKGFIKIQRGSDELGMERFFIALNTKTEDNEFILRETPNENQSSTENLQKWNIFIFLAMLGFLF